MQAIILPCTANCGRTRTIELQDGAIYKGDPYLCAFDDPRFKTPEQTDADRKAADDAALKASIDAELRLKGLIL